MIDITDVYIASEISYRRALNRADVIQAFIELSNILKEIKATCQVTNQDARVFVTSITIYYKLSEDKFYLYV